MSKKTDLSNYGIDNLGKKRRSGRNGPDAIALKWISDERLALIAGWRRDGYTVKDIANRIGVSQVTINQWRRDYKEIDEALSRGSEIVDYMVENALLKSALGYQTKETKVTTTMRFGKVVETMTETTEKEQAPNVTAIQMWLYNRQRDKWKNMNNAKNVFEEMEEDTSIEITVKRASKNELEEEEAEEKQITLRKRSEEEAEEIRKQKREEKKNKDKTQIYDDDDEIIYEDDEE